jgi:hypothetical protein
MDDMDQIKSWVFHIKLGKGIVEPLLLRARRERRSIANLIKFILADALAKREGENEELRELVRELVREELANVREIDTEE